MTAPKTERRSQKRVQVQLPVSLKAGRGETSTGHTRDLSSNGIFLYTDAPISEGSDLEMVLMLPPELTNGEKRWVCCQASVVRVEGSKEGVLTGVAADIRHMATMPEIPV